MQPILYKVTHHEKAYKGAGFVAACTEVHDGMPDRCVSEAEAVGMYAAHKQDMLNKGWKPIFSNVFGTWFERPETTTSTHVGWHSSNYLSDTPIPITKGTFWYMLEVLFPANWIGANSLIETFQMTELQTGNITSTMVRVGNAYWHTYDTMGLSQDHIISNLKLKLQTQANENNFTGRERSLTCSCCGALTSGVQYHNKDTGFGLCNQCMPLNSRRGADVNEMVEVFGVQGIHYAVLR